ncbi:MAG: TrkA family potassium uptake protein [Myxococcota bacterium]
MKQAIIVGLGMFGMSLARELAKRRVEVILVDRNRDRVQVASEFAVEALVLDATDELALAELRPDRRDLSVCAIGEDSRDASILCTALLRQLGSRHLVARAFDELHGRILSKVGAHEVVNPEKAFGLRLATRLAFRGVLDQVPLGRGLEISELALPAGFVGKTLRELSLPKRFGLYAVAVRGPHDDEQDDLQLPNPDAVLEVRDILVLAGGRGAVEAMLEKVR